MRKNRNGKRETWGMVLSSVGVLSVLTVAGLYMRGTTQEGENYVVDFSSMEQESMELAQNDAQNEAENLVTQPANTSNAVNDRMIGGGGAASIRQEAVTENDLDYDPAFREASIVPAGSGTSIHQEESAGGQAQGTDQNAVKAEEKTEKTSQNTVSAEDKTESTEVLTGEQGEESAGNTQDPASVEAAAMEGMENTMALATSAAIQPALSFGEQDTLAWPIVGNVLINYSMDKTVYFPTLDQYKYHPAIVIAASEGASITAAADGKVIRVAADAQLGNIVVMELGNGYELTYGQLKDITVSEGGYVKQGDIIGCVAAPTKYYSVEGCNVHFQLTRDGEPVDPMSKLQ